jgi:hypothetical protein
VFWRYAGLDCWRVALLCCGALNERVLDGRGFDERELEARELDERDSAGRALFCCTWVELFCERVTGVRLALFCERAKVLLLRLLLEFRVASAEVRVLLFERAKFES